MIQGRGWASHTQYSATPPQAMSFFPVQVMSSVRGCGGEAVEYTEMVSKYLVLYLYFWTMADRCLIWNKPAASAIATIRESCANTMAQARKIEVRTSRHASTRHAQNVISGQTHGWKEVRSRQRDHYHIRDSDSLPLPASRIWSIQ